MNDQSMTATEWLNQFAAALDLPAPTHEQFEALLELAGIAAHASERIAAPLACWLAAQSQKPADELKQIAEQIG